MHVHIFKCWFSWALINHCPAEGGVGQVLAPQWDEAPLSSLSSGPNGSGLHEAEVWLSPNPSAILIAAGVTLSSKQSLWYQTTATLWRSRWMIIIQFACVCVLAMNNPLAMALTLTTGSVKVRWNTSPPIPALLCDWSDVCSDTPQTQPPWTVIVPFHGSNNTLIKDRHCTHCSKSKCYCYIVWFSLSM